MRGRGRGGRVQIKGPQIEMSDEKKGIELATERLSGVEVGQQLRRSAQVM